MTGTAAKPHRPTPRFSRPSARVARTATQQSIGTMVTQGDFQSLADSLRRLGGLDAEIADLESAMDGDRKAGEGTPKVGVGVGATVIPKLISGYLGLSE